MDPFLWNDSDAAPLPDPNIIDIFDPHLSDTEPDLTHDLAHIIDAADAPPPPAAAPRPDPSPSPKPHLPQPAAPDAQKPRPPSPVNTPPPAPAAKQPPAPEDEQPATPSNSTQPWESEVATLQTANAQLTAALADVPALLARLDRQNHELAAARRRLRLLEADKLALHHRLEPVAKRPRVDNTAPPPACRACSIKPEPEPSPHRLPDPAPPPCGVAEWLDRFVDTDAAACDMDLQRVRFGQLIVDTALRKGHPVDSTARTVYGCLIHADEEKSLRILRLIASVRDVKMEEPAPLADNLVTAILESIRKAVEQRDADPVTTNDVVRVLLQATSVRLCELRVASGFLATFVALHHTAQDLLRLVFSSNRHLLTAVFRLTVEDDGDDSLWSSSLRAVLTHFMGDGRPTQEQESASKAQDTKILLARWNHIRTAVLESPENSSRTATETCLQLECSIQKPAICYDVVVKLALMSRVEELVSQPEKLERLLGLIGVACCTLAVQEGDDLRRKIDETTKYLVTSACAAEVEPRQSAAFIGTAAEIMRTRACDLEQNETLKADLKRWGERKSRDEDVRLLSPEALAFLRERNVLAAKGEAVHSDDAMRD